MVKVSSGGSLPGGEGSLLLTPLAPSRSPDPLTPHLPACPNRGGGDHIVSFRVPTTSFEAKGQGSKKSEGARGVREEGEQGPWVWLKTQGCWRLPKAPKASWGLREGLRGWGSNGVRGVRGKGEQGEQGPWVWLKTQGCQRPLMAPKAFWGPREIPWTQGQGMWGGARGTRSLSLTEDPKMLKSS